MKEELWKDIPGYEGIYQASNLGRIRSLDIERMFYYCDGRKSNRILKGRILKPYPHSSGYKVVSLYKDGECALRTIHGLIFSTFVRQPSTREIIRFKDGDKTNLALDNLECVMRKGNLTWKGKKDE